MTRATHTPGPWPLEPTGDGKRILIGKGLVDGPDGYEVAEVYSDDCDTHEAMANARLIAAAPELLAALEKAVARQGFSNEELIDARAAIRKATGQ